MWKLVLSGIVLVILILFVLVNYFIGNQNKKNVPGLPGLKKEINRISPSPFPFQEMTIPYLRFRSYQSALGERQEVSRNEDYISYRTSYKSDGLTIYGQLTMPVGEKPADGWPAIVFVHGYISPKNYQTFSNYASFVDFLAREGFVVFKIDLRGHDDSEGEAGGAYYSSDYIIDTLNAYSALQSSDFVNSNKIGLWGHSMAGNVLSRSLAAKPEIPAVAIWAGAVYTYSDFAEFGIADNSYRPPTTDTPGRRRRTELFAKYGQFNPNSEFWKQVPMTNYLSNIKGAISLNHAIDDDVVDIGYSRNLNNILDKTEIIHELNEYPSGGHNLTGETFTLAMEKTVDFFKKHLN